MGVIRLGYVHVRVTDLPGAADHYRNTLGMDQVADTDGRLYLKSWDEHDHHSVVLEEGGVGLVKLGYKVSHAADLDDYEDRATAFGATVARMSKGDNVGIGDGLRITLPSDHVLELYSDVEYLGNAPASGTPTPGPAKAARHRGPPPGPHPHHHRGPHPAGAVLHRGPGLPGRRTPGRRPGQRPTRRLLDVLWRTTPRHRLRPG